MQYKTIVLELLQQQTELHEQLRLTRRLFPTMEALAKDLKARHETWKQELQALQPSSDPIQIASEALEMAHQRSGESFALRVSSGRDRAAFARPGDGLYPKTFVERVRPGRGQQTFFDRLANGNGTASSSPTQAPAPEPNQNTNGKPAADQSGPAPAINPPLQPRDSTSRPDHEVTAQRPEDAGKPTATIAEESTAIAQGGGNLNKAPPPSEFLSSGEKTKARDIITAIRTLKALENEGRPATAEEKQLLGRFSGFGPVALSIFPDPITGKYKDAGWQALGEELKTLLTPVEYDSAKRTTFNAFYTSPTVIHSIHEAIGHLGVPAKATILEPGCGSGNFMSLARPDSHFIGVEMDSISGRIARLRHPEHEIRIENFRDTRLPENRIDAVVGNVPFADLKLDHKGQKYSLHDYFFAKSIDALKPGGVLALVTSHFTLDKQNAAIREYLASQADFVGAIRLPSDAFKREGTAVVTDIVFLRKRDRGEPARHVDNDWLGVAPLAIDGAEVPVNRYFLNHPEMVLGKWTRKDTLYGGEGYSVLSNGDLASNSSKPWLGSPGSSRFKRRPPKTSPLRPSRPRRKNATSTRAASSSPTTRSSTRSKADRECRSSMAARR